MPTSDCEAVDFRIDIDVFDESLAKEIEDISLLILGPAPRRVGLPPKRLLIYRCNTTFPKMSIRFETDSNQKFLVEVLAEGQQYVIHGIHPSNKKPYTCEPSLDHMHSDELSVIDEKKINQFFCELRTILSKKGFRLINCHAPKEKHLLIDQKSLKGDPEMVSAALEVIPNDTSYDEWIWFGHAVKAALQDNENLAMELWARFSQRWIHGKTEQALSKISSEASMPHSASVRNGFISRQENMASIPHKLILAQWRKLYLTQKKLSSD